MSPTSHEVVLALNGVGNFKGGGDYGEAEKEPASSSETESRFQSAEDDDEPGGKEESEDASEGQPEGAEDRESGGEGKGNAAELTSAEDDDESGGKWTTNRAKEAKRGPVRLEVGGASAPVLPFPEK